MSPDPYLAQFGRDMDAFETLMPGLLASYQRDLDAMKQKIKDAVENKRIVRANTADGPVFICSDPGMTALMVKLGYVARDLPTT